MRDGSLGLCLCSSLEQGCASSLTWDSQQAMGLQSLCSVGWLLGKAVLEEPGSALTDLG